MTQPGGMERRRDREGLITGYVFKLVRESVRLTQEKLAEALGVDPHTVQGWESSRRPLTAASAGTFAQLRRQLRALGAEPEMLDALSTAVDADYLLTYALGMDPAGSSSSRHPLARWVLPRETSEMLAWAVNGDAPERVRSQAASARRRGPVAEGPVLAPAERLTFIEHFRATAERSLQ
ncbi:MAG: helix-turn-helix domain-containing protein, partial [Actinomycetota bacterium]